MSQGETSTVVPARTGKPPRTSSVTARRGMTGAEGYIRSPSWMQACSKGLAPSLASIPARRIAVAIHALAAVAMILVFILHVYAAFWTRGTLRAMTRGTVTGGWAWRHHRKWLRELAGRQSRSPAE